MYVSVVEYFCHLHQMAARLHTNTTSTDICISICEGRHKRTSVYICMYTSMSMDMHILHVNVNADVYVDTRRCGCKCSTPTHRHISSQNRQMSHKTNIRAYNYILAHDFSAVPKILEALDRGNLPLRALSTGLAAAPAASTSFSSHWKLLAFWVSGKLQTAYLLPGREHQAPDFRWLAHITSSCTKLPSCKPPYMLVVRVSYVGEWWFEQVAWQATNKHEALRVCVLSIGHGILSDL